MTCALAFGLLGLSLTSEGLFITQVDLNDSGVWVTNQAALHIGRYNHSAKQLDGASYVTESSRFDVLQDRATVFVLGPDEGRIVPVTPATLKMAPPVAMGVGAQISLGGSMVSVFSPIEGKYWLVPASAAASLDPTSDVIPAAISELSSETIAIVGADGTGYVVDPVAQVLYTVGSERVSFAGEVSVKSQSLKGLSEKGEFALTVVGQTPVLLDRTAGTLHIGASRSLPLLVDNDTDVVVLQAVAESGDAIVYSTPTAVITQPLRGGDPNVVPAPATRGLPAPAVVLEGCTYAVWSGTGAFVRDCVDEGNDLVKVIPGIDPNDELRFRVNWGHIVLNQVQSGGVWLVTNQIIKVDNWDAVIETQDQMDDQDSSDDLDQMEKPDRTGENHPPRAYDDAFGARAGTSVLLPVVENDLDEDGDLLTVELLGDLPRGYTISTVYSNSVFQLNVPATATGTLSFRYKVSDGRGGEDEANVKVAIYSDSINTAPTAIRSTVLTVTSGHQVTHNILSNWRDPEGDPIFLIGAITSPEDMVTTLQDGSVTFQDGGVSTGVKVVQVTVSDGKLATTSEVLVNVLPAGNRPPVAVPDLVSGTAGTPIMIRPLDNDTDPDGDVLRLTAVEGDSRCSLTKELSQGYVTAVCHSPGSVYLTYTVTDGRSVNVEGWIRVVVTPPATTNDPPIAVPDTVLLTQGQETYVKPLENDIDPLGFPLVITKIETGVDLPIDVSVIDFEVVKITPNREFSTPISLNYTISNGVGFATSRILVVPVPAPERILPPRAVDDTVVVRVGDIANVAVLSNDIQPNGIGLRLRPDLPSVPNPETEALVFTSGNLIRIHARAPGTYTVLYQVENVKGNAESDTGRLTIHVRDVDTGDNQAPKPRDVEVRTLAGRAVTVPIPLDGIDPDGDFVTLVGLGSAPTKGAITATTSRSFVYDPGTSIGGGDSFTYVVRDRLGLEATGTVRVGIAPATSYNRPPIAMTDFVDARPGSLVTVPVTANDTGPDAADCCFLVANSVVSEDFEAKTQGNDVVITAPSTPGSYWGTYEVADEFGQTSTGVIALRVAADIELRKPIARDDEVPLVEALKNPTVTISVKDNDRDPDGDISLAKITVNDPNAVVVGDQVTVTITPDWQIIDYYITDTDGLVGHAFILVPGVDTIGPQYNPAVRILEVRTGETVSVPLSSYVVVRPGRQPRVTQAATVTAWNGTVEARTVTELRFTAPQDYVGPAAITLEVTDGANLEDDTGLVALVTIPVRVIPRDDGSGINLPPTMLSVDLNVEVGESGTLQLDRLVTNPEPTDTLTFNLVSESPL
ncbi:MAG: hypothetical protein LBE83_01580, partial [Propionibacteriaceae bacterium]|nr:hypothetical protein [Propionibacteriaceae bacterium]